MSLEEGICFRPGALERGPTVDAIEFLDWEGPETTNAGEVGHYIRIYCELIDLTRYRLMRASRASPRPATPARLEPVPLEAPVLAQRLEHFEERMQFWCHRLWQLKSVDIDVRQLLIRHRGMSISLTRRELQLLTYLLRHPDRLFTARQLAHAAWGSPHLGDDELRTYISRLRRKIHISGLPCRIINRIRKGYCLTFD